MTPTFTYSSEKNAQLIKERNISFEEVIVAISENRILDILVHPDPKKYVNQKIYVLFLKDYVYLVPFVKDENGNIFLKTIIPSRKAMQTYKGNIYEKES